VVTACHDAERFIRKNLESIHSQNYPKARYRQIVIDDASDDTTREVIERFIAEHAAPSIEYVRNERRLGGCANYTRCFRSAPPGSIVLQVDGDDWLPDRRVLARLNTLYQDPGTWMTYNSWAFPDGRPSLNSRPIAEDVISRGAFRDAPWTASHLHSFRARLFAHVRDESLIDPESGDYFRSAVDMAHYFPMLELAGRHARHVDQVLYVYNLHERSIERHAREQQLGCERRIRSLQRYAALHSLD